MKGPIISKDLRNNNELLEARNREASGIATIEKTLALLEVVAECGVVSAKELSSTLGYPLPTIYRFVQALVAAGYLVHLKSEKSYGLGYKIHQLGVSLHRQIGVSGAVRSHISQLHESAGAAGYFAVYRGADVVVGYVSECPKHPRLTPIKFGFHEGAHATAFGKIMLNGMTDEQRNRYFEVHPLTPLTSETITDRRLLDEHLETVGIAGIAWEIEEFVLGMTCAAIGVRNAAGLTVGSVAVSAPSANVRGREHELEIHLRKAAAEVSRYFRTGTSS
jgi:IclR family acetate operon transcriptional repressor